MTTARTASSSLTNSVFLDRWSPRSFSAEAVTNEQLDALFEAARWAPSWMNNQPWLFAYDTNGDGRQPILDSFMDFNRGWAAAAPVVGLVLARTDLEDFMARTRDFDTGAAMMSLTLQATMLGLSVHLLGGVDLDADADFDAPMTESMDSPLPRSPLDNSPQVPRAVQMSIDETPKPQFANPMVMGYVRDWGSWIWGSGLRLAPPSLKHLYARSA